MHEYAHSEWNAYNWNLYILSHDRKPIYSNAMFWKCVRVICMIIGISSLSHDSHPCNVCIDHTIHDTIHVNWCNISVLTCTRALARCDHRQIVWGFYLVSSQVRVFVGRRAVEIQSGWRIRCYSGCRCSLIWENCVVSTDAVISCCMKHNRRGVELWRCDSGNQSQL